MGGFGERITEVRGPPCHTVPGVSDVVMTSYCDMNTELNAWGHHEHSSLNIFRNHMELWFLESGRQRQDATGTGPGPGMNPLRAAGRQVFKNELIIFGCAGSSLPCMGFL